MIDDLGDELGPVVRTYVFRRALLLYGLLQVHALVFTFPAAEGLLTDVVLQSRPHRYEKTAVGFSKHTDDLFCGIIFLFHG